MAAEATLEKFMKNFRGELIKSGDPAYDSARKVWNGLIDKHPAYIARCADEKDISSAVNFAVANKLTVAVRGGGHNVGGFGMCDNGIVIDLSAMRKIFVDPQNLTAHAQGGLTWGEFDEAVQKHALSTTGGLVSETGIGGLTLGGGIGWLMRLHGLTIDNLLSVKIVTADGRLLTANEKENPDLFWAVRGGGGNFGIVSEFTYRLHQVGPMVFGGAIFVPFERAAKLLRFYRQWVKSLPDELTTMFAFLTTPPAPFIPQHLQGTLMAAIALCFPGGSSQAEELVRPLREFAKPEIDMLGPIPYVKLQKLFDESAPSGILSYWKTEYLRDLNDDLINTMIEHTGKMGAPFAQFHIQHLEGAVSRIADDATAFSHRDSPFIINIIGMWKDPEETGKYMNWVRTFDEAVKPHSTGGVYLNFMGSEGEERVKTAFGEKKYMRLVEIKDKYDPGNLFCNNQNIKPSVKQQAAPGKNY